MATKNILIVDNGSTDNRSHSRHFNGENVTFQWRFAIRNSHFVIYEMAKRATIVDRSINKTRIKQEVKQEVTFYRINHVSYQNISKLFLLG